MKFKVEKMECGGCANMIKTLSSEFGDIKTDVDNRIVEVDISKDKIKEFKDRLSELGFDAKEI